MGCKRVRHFLVTKQISKKKKKTKKQKNKKTKHTAQKTLLYSIVCVCVCVCVYHIFIHSAINGHIVCFHILAIVNSGVHVSFELWFSLDICPCVGSHGSSYGKKSAFNTENPSSIPGMEDPLGKGVVTIPVFFFFFSCD